MTQARHQARADDLEFVRRFEEGAIAPAQFRHRDHVRLAYVYLATGDVTTASERMRDALIAFLCRNNIAESRYHETITRAWILAIDHFMRHDEPAAGADEFIERNPRLLDTTILFAHYTRATLGSDAARVRFVEPDVRPIPA